MNCLFIGWLDRKRKDDHFGLLFKKAIPAQNRKKA